MIKHFLEALYLPYVRSNEVKWHNFSSGANMSIVLCFLLIQIGWGLGVPMAMTKLWPDRLALDSFGAIIPFVFAVDYLLRLISLKDGYIDTGLGSYLTLPVKRRIVFLFTFIRYCTSDKTMGWQPLLFVVSLILIAPVYGVLPTIAWLIAFYVWTLVNNLLASEIGRTQYSIRLNTVILCIYGVWSYFAMAKGLGMLPVRYICENLSVFFSLAQIVLLYGVAELYLWYKSCSRYSIIEGVSNKTSSVSGWLDINRINSVLKLRLFSLKGLDNLGIFSFMLILPILTIIYIKFNFFDAGGGYKSWLSMLVFAYVINFCRCTFAFESTFFDRIATLPFSLEKVLRTDYIIFNLFQTLIFVITFLVCDNIDAAFLFSLVLFSAGPVSAITFYMAATQIIKIDSSMRVRSDNKGSLLKSLILLVVPLLVLITPGIVELIFSSHVATLYKAISGVVFILASPYWIKLSVRRFNKNKYDNLKIYREKI